MPVGRFGRADRCRRLAELASFGRDEGAKQTFYGLRAHLRVCWPGVITDGHLAPATLHDLTMADDLLAGAHGWALGDRSDWSPARAGLLADQGVWLVAPSRSARRPGPRLPRRLIQARRRIETVIGQLVERYHAKRVWARDAWHLWSRWQRKLLSHTWPSTCASRPASAPCASPTSSTANPHTGLANGASSPRRRPPRRPAEASSGTSPTSSTATWSPITVTEPGPVDTQRRYQATPIGLRRCCGPHNGNWPRGHRALERTRNTEQPDINKRSLTLSQTLAADPPHPTCWSGPLEARRRAKVIGRLPGERSWLSLVWAVLDRASRRWRGLTSTPGRPPAAPRPPPRPLCATATEVIYRAGCVLRITCSMEPRPTAFPPTNGTRPRGDRA